MAYSDKAPLILSFKLMFVSQQNSCCAISLGTQIEKNKILEEITSVTCSIYLCAAGVPSHKLAFLVYVSDMD